MTFTAGQVLTAAQLNALDITSLTVDTDTLVVDATNDRVGINTASPSVALDVGGSVVIDDDLTVDTSTLKVDSTNNRVGVGTATPTQALDVSGTATATALAVTGQFTLPTSDGSADQVMVTNGSGTVTWANQSGGGGTPGGSDGQVQYNNGGSFGGAAQLTYNDSTGVVTPGGIDAFQAANSVTSSSAKFKFGRSSSQHLAFHGESYGNIITSISQTSNVKNMRIVVSHDDGATGTTYDFGTGGRGLGIGGVAETGKGLDVYTGGITIRGDLLFHAHALISSNDNNSTTNIDHIWHDDSANAWNFCSDTTYKAAGNSTIVAGVVQTPLVNGAAASTRDKLRVWNSSSYAIGMQSGITFGALNDYAMTFQMNNDSDRGFWWGDTSHGVNQGAMSLTTNGKLYVANNIKVGFGETNTSDTFSYDLEVGGTSYFSDRMIIRANGGDILTLEDSGGTNESGYINFANSAGTSLGYIGYGNNDDIHIKNNDSGGNIYMGVATRWALQIDTNGNLLPYADNQHYLGTSGRAWNHFYLHQGNQFSSGGYWTLRSRDSDRQVMELVSSERYKKDIVDMPLTEAYQVLDARVIKYRGIDDDDDTPLEAGLSAESLHDAGYEYAVRYDEGHWGETPRSIYYEYLTVPLIKICKDQKDRIELLEARVATLEAA